MPQENVEDICGLHLCTQLIRAEGGSLRCTNRGGHSLVDSPGGWRDQHRPHMLAVMIEEVALSQPDTLQCTGSGNGNLWHQIGSYDELEGSSVYRWK